MALAFRGDNYPDTASSKASRLGGGVKRDKRSITESCILLASVVSFLLLILHFCTGIARARMCFRMVYAAKIVSAGGASRDLGASSDMFPSLTFAVLELPWVL